MDDLTIRPTAKFVMVRAVIAVLVFLAIEILWYTKLREGEKYTLMPYVAPVFLLWPLPGAFRRMFTRLTLSGDRLHLVTGAVSKNSRTIQISKLQDVTVSQSMVQRVFGVGNVSIETSGAGSWEAIQDVDHPQALADELLDRAHHFGKPA